MIVSDELRRLRDSPQADEQPVGGLLSNFMVSCYGDAQIVIARVRDVLKIVLGRADDNWPSDDDWRSILPTWFVNACAPERTPEESQKWLTWWQSLPVEEQGKVENEEPWSLGDFLHWFQNSEDRQWAWWDAQVLDPDTLQVTVEPQGLPFASDAIEWLIRAAGAKSVTKD